MGILCDIVANKFVFVTMWYFGALIEYPQPIDLLDHLSNMKIRMFIDGGIEIRMGQPRPII